MEERYLKNYLGKVQDVLLTKHIGVIGCGGNGGYVVEFLARLGVKEISLWDGDVFEKSNLNRQIYCNSNTLGAKKSIIANVKAFEINPDIQYHSYDNYFGDTMNDFKFASKCDLLFLCADVDHNWVKQRTMLKLLLANNIPMIDCAININGPLCQLFTKDNIDLFNQYTQQQKYWLTHKESYDTPQPAYLCAMAAAEGIKMMINYFSPLA